MTGENASVFVTPQLYEQIVGSDRNLIAIETPRPDEVLAQFRHFAVRSGSSIYWWNETEGVTSLRDSNASIPGSARLADALRHIGSSIHYGVYLFPKLGAQLRFAPNRAQSLAALRQFAKARSGTNVRKLVMIDTQITEGLEELAMRIRDEPTTSKRLRLRDGRWVR
ncbi:MAG TPA: hypothetical protein VFO79_10180 [Xanthomonadales bacterium]|nr:hypothetical protein [Xanthomonadales bacterium]